jgi:CBS domain containing-hemolysin-like protein
MFTFIVAVICIAIAVAALTLQKTYYFVPLKELKRQAAARDPLAEVLFRAAAHGDNLKVLLWFIIGLMAAIGIELFARIAPPLLGLLVVALTLWLAFIWLPGARLTSFGVRLAVWLTPAVVWPVSSLTPVLRFVAGVVKRHTLANHSGLFERSDLSELIEQQKFQADNRISDEELEMVRRVLKFGERTVRDILTARKKVKAVSLAETIGPVLLDELHASEHARFPVYDGKPKNIVGTLSLRDIVGVKHGGAVSDHYDKRVYYVHEADSLTQALHAFYQTKQHLFVVINSFDEYVGIITVEDLLHQLIGPVPTASSPAHDDRKAVVSRHDKPVEKPVEPDEPLSEGNPEVVE